MKGGALQALTSEEQHASSAGDVAGPPRIFAFGSTGGLGAGLLLLV